MIYRIGDFEMDCADPALLKALRADTDGCIVLEIVSNGGNVLEFMELASVVEELRAAGKKIVTYAMSRALSAGLCTLLLGDEIYVSKYTMILHHNAMPGDRLGALLHFVFKDPMVAKFDQILEQLYPEGLIGIIKKNHPCTNKIAFLRSFNDDYNLSAQDFISCMGEAGREVVLGAPRCMTDGSMAKWAPAEEPVREGTCGGSAEEFPLAEDEITLTEEQMEELLLLADEMAKKEKKKRKPR